MKQVIKKIRQWWEDTRPIKFKERMDFKVIPIYQHADIIGYRSRIMVAIDKEGKNIEWATEQLKQDHLTELRKKILRDHVMFHVDIYPLDQSTHEIELHTFIKILYASTFPPTL